MRYVGYIHRLFEMIKDKNPDLSIDDIISCMYESMNKDKSIINGITKIEIEQALRYRNLI